MPTTTCHGVNKVTTLHNFQIELLLQVSFPALSKFYSQMQLCNCNERPLINIAY